MEHTEAMKEALEIVKAQASVRAMSEDEITAMLAKLTAGIMGLDGGDTTSEAPGATDPATDPKKAIREASVTCLECGKSFKILTKKHLAHHGLTPAEYRAKYGYKKTQALACKALARERRKKMGETKPWERRKKAEGEKA